jgi:hypothetical protein
MKNLFSIFIIFLFFGCVEEPTPTVEKEDISLASVNFSGSGYNSDGERLQKHDLTGIFLTVEMIRIKGDEGWLDIPADYPFVIDLVSISDSESFLNAFSIEPGSYSEIRLIVASENNDVVVEGKGNYVKKENGFIYPLKVPSGSSSGFKIKGAFTIELNKTYKLSLDFDIDESIVQLGNKDEYLLKPTVQLKVEENFGFIHGTLVESVPIGTYEIIVYENGRFSTSEILNNAGPYFENALTRTFVNDMRTFIVPNLEPGKYDIYIALHANNKPPALTDHLFIGLKVEKGKILMLEVN